MPDDRSREPPEIPADPPPFEPFRLQGTHRIYDSPWCGLRRDELLLPDGRRQDYHVFEVSDAVAVVPVLPDGSLVMIGQYRYPHGKTHWEIPAGRIDDGEQPQAAAARELLEETGYRARTLVKLPGFYPTSGISAHYAHLFCGIDCERVERPAPDAAEQIVVRVFGPEEIEALLRGGRIEDGFTALAILYYLQLRPEG